MDNTEENKHKYKAVDVTGMVGGSLMCEVRHSNQDENKSKAPRSNRRPDLNTTDESVKKEWMVVRRKVR